MDSLDLEEALNLGRVQHLKLRDWLPKGRLPKNLDAVGFRLPDYHYAGSGDLVLFALYGEDSLLFLDCGPANMTDRSWFDRLIDTYVSTPEEARLYLTHFHFDHIGEAPWFVSRGVSAFGSKESLRLLDIDPHGYATMVGAFRDTPIQGIEAYSWFQRSLVNYVPDVQMVEEGTRFECGTWRLKSIQLPGHAAGNSGLITEDRIVLFSGDSIASHPSVFAQGLDNHDAAAAIDCWSMLRGFPLEWLITAHEGIFRGDEEIDKVLIGQVNGLTTKANRVLDELGSMNGYVTPCEFVEKHKGVESVLVTASMGKYMNALNVQHYLALLEFLYDYEKLRRRFDDDGAVVYEPARYRSFFA